MLVGKSKHSIDAKGRLTIPSKFREELGEKFVVARSVEGCLCAYTAAEWEKMRKTLSSFPVFNKRLQDLKLSIMLNADECEVDSMGRILLSQDLRDSVGIGKDVVLVGAFDYLQIWDAETLKKPTIEEAYANLTEEEKKIFESMRSSDGI